MISSLLPLSVYMDYCSYGSVNFSSMFESHIGNSELVIQKAAVQFLMALICRKLYVDTDRSGKLLLKKYCFINREASCLPWGHLTSRLVLY